MATAYHQPVDAFNATPDGQQIFVPTAKYNSYRERQYAPRMNPSRSSSYNDYPIEKQGFDNNIGMSPDTEKQRTDIDEFKDILHDRILGSHQNGPESACGL